ncbi:hypothetical protein ACFU9F_13520 [Streptomyces zhihengii]|uniref:hypothetical protein n=1 Tax=Streptomyces zhihengii TaxID=1818004 RepID=UPI00369ECEA9
MTLSRGARITGAALAALLALMVAAWIARDLGDTGSAAALWRSWTGGAPGFVAVAQPATTVVEPALLLVYAAVAVAALRSPVAAAALVAAGVLTLGLRLPALWVLTASYMDLQATDAVRTRALYSAFAALALGTGLLVTAAAGRRPAGERQFTRQAPGAEALTPTRPGRGAAVTAFLLLGTSAAVVVAWQARWAWLLGADVWLDLLTGGDRAPVRLLEVPSAWLALTVAALALVAAGCGLARAVLTRPLGAAVAVLLAADGAVGVAHAVRQELWRYLGELPLERHLVTATALFELVGGAVLLAVLLRPGEPVPGGDGAPGGTAPSGYGYPPARAPGYGYPPARPSYGYPPARPAPGYGYPPPDPSSGFGPPPSPPPPASPPPGW